MGFARGLLLALIPLTTGSHLASNKDCADWLGELEGYTVVKVGTLNGEFNGCDFDRLVEFDDGTLVRCSSYGYQYAYGPTAAVFARRVTYQGSTITLAKLLVEDELYDVRLRP